VKVIIIGGGIGGLTAALAFNQFGHEVSVHERASVLREVGAGIQLSPNAIKPLRALGLEPDIQAVASAPDTLTMRDGFSGRALFSLPIAERAQARFGAGYFTIHRADMITLLREALIERCPYALNLNRTFVRVSQSTNEAVAHFKDGTRVSADLIIGADGINSAVRKAITPTDPARFTGQLAWRAIVPCAPDHPLAKDTNVWTASGKHVVTYGLRRGHVLNIVGVVEDRDWRDESWSHEGRAEDMRADLAGFAPVVSDLLKSVETCFKWALHDRPPLDIWSKGRVTLLGDAVHPMLPFMAQGACMAIEDAYVLARAVSEHTELKAALTQYQDRRLARTRKVHAVAGRNAHLFHMRNPLARQGFRIATGFADRMLKEALWAQTDWIYAHDVTE
jgi:salicylate hydroxylase